MKFRFCCAAALALAIAVGAMAWLFLIHGDTLPSDDGRTAIRLSPGERNLVLGEMRTFLGSVQAMVAAAAANDPKAMAEAARRVGAAQQRAVPATLVGKLPMEFKKLGFDTHRRFDAIALDVEQMEETAIGTARLAELMNNCVACHATYRFDPAAE